MLYLKRRLYIKMDEVTALHQRSQNIWIAPWWLPAVWVIQSNSSILPDENSKDTSHTMVYVISLLVTPMFVQVFMFLISLVLINHLML